MFSSEARCSRHPYCCKVRGLGNASRREASTQNTCPGLQFLGRAAVELKWEGPGKSSRPKRAKGKHSPGSNAGTFQARHTQVRLNAHRSSKTPGGTRGAKEKKYKFPVLNALVMMYSLYDSSAAGSFEHGGYFFAVTVRPPVEGVF